MGTNGYEQAVTYDSYGRPVDTRTRAATGEAWDWVSQSYDGLGRPDVTTYPARDGSGSTTAGGTASERFQVRAVYAPSGDLWKLEERLTNGSPGTTYWTATGRSVQGALTDETLGNGLSTHQEVDRATGTLGSITTGTTPGGTSVQNLVFTFDAADNLTAREDRVAGLKESFTYDGLQRLSGASRYASLTATTPAETQTFTYDPTGNLLGKGSQYTGYSYTATTGCTNPHAQPHAVRQVTAGGSPRSYCYDANGNLTTISGANAGYTAVSWWAANLARRMSKGSTSAEFWYGPDRARVLQVATRATESERTVYLGSLYERTVITPNTTGSATTRHVHYVRAGDETLAIKTWSKVGTGAYTPQVRYPHRDHLGSVVAITTETGTVESRSSFDAWGKRRDPATWVTPAPGTFTAAPTVTDRGFTGHEHVDELGLVHMNGRIYDPEIGKFLSADPTMQFPESTQGYNRYAYAGNNPLTFTDPSGFSFWKSLMKVVGVFLSYLPLPTNLFLRVLWQFVVGYLESGGSVTAGLNRVTGGLYGRIRDSNTSARGPPSSPALITNLAPGRSGAESPAKDADWQQITESIRWHLGTARRTDASDATNGERKSAAGRATETSAFSYLVPLAPAAEVAVSFIPVVSTGVALFAVYVAYSDPNATTEDRAYALIGIVPFGKIAGLLAHYKVVLAAIKVAEKGGGKAAGGGADVAKEIGILRDAARGKGNFGLGSATPEEVQRLGRAWVGNGYKVGSDGKTLISADGLRQFRPSALKPSLGIEQANFEQRLIPQGQWQGNGHLDVISQ